MKRKSRRQLIRQGRATLIQQKQTVITVVLLTALVLLLLGIFGQLPAPEPTVSEPDTTAIDYSAFLAQVRARNVLVVSLHDREMVGVLARPLTGGRAIATSWTKMTQRQAVSALDAWYYSPGSDVPDQGTGTTAAAHLPQPAQLVSTRLPEFGDAALIPLLISKHVVIKTQPSTHLPTWFLQLWKVLPFFVLLMLLLWALCPRRHVRSPGAPGDFMSFHSTRKCSACSARAIKRPGRC